jgi:hypothetical protein
MLENVRPQLDSEGLETFQEKYAHPINLARLTTWPKSRQAVILTPEGTTCFVHYPNK